MAFYLAQAAKACKNPAARSVYSASALLRLSASANRIPTDFSKLTASHNCTPTLSSTLNFARYNSSAALARKPQESAVSGDSGDAALSFDSLKGVISEPVLRAITGPMGISNLSAVQKEVLPLLPDLARPYSPDEPESSPPRDLLVKAKTGTGKTLAFLVPAIEKRLQEIERHVEQAANDVGKTEDARFKKDVRYQYTKDTVGTVILSPTRELAGQIGKEALKLTAGIDRGSFGVQVLIGGEDKRYQMRQFKGGRRDIVVATPGRMRDLLDSEPEFRRAVETAQLLILDEADTLLDMGFRSDIESIASELPPSPQRQTFLFSATVSQQIRQIARSTLHKKHKFINCVAADDSPVHHHVPQFHTVCPSPAEQLPHILRLIAHDQLVNPGASKVIVFLPTTRWTQMFATILTELKDRILPAGRSTTMYEIHSKKDQDRRTRVSERFRQDKTGASILVTSDVSARGVDYPGVTRVIQVGISSSGDHYVHRVGRTGRGSSTLNGRGDLVLLDWESGFAKPGGPLAELGVPLKGVTVNALKEEVETLAKKFDEDPQGFFPESVAAEPERRGKLSLSGRSRESRQTTSKGPIGPRQFQKSMTEALSSESIDGAIKELHGMLDSQDVNDVFASNLGYYLGKFEELNLRGSKEEVIEGLKDWTMEAFGLEKRPYVSDALLLRMGVKGDSNRRGGGGGSFGMRRSGGYGSSDRGGDRFGSRSRSVEDRSFNRDRSSTWGGERSFDRPRSNSMGSFGGRSSFDGGRSRDGGERKPQGHWMGRGRSSGKSRSQNDFY